MAILPQDLENKLWSTADQLRANSELTSAEYKTPVLGSDGTCRGAARDNGHPAPTDLRPQTRH